VAAGTGRPDRARTGIAALSWPRRRPRSEAPPPAAGRRSRRRRRQARTVRAPMPDGGFRRRPASSRGTARASSRACALVRVDPIEMRARPELETDERPDPLRVVARAALVLAKQHGDLARVRPAALRGSRIHQNVARPRRQALAEPAAQRNAESALGPSRDIAWHPRRYHLAKQPLRRLHVVS